MSEQPLALAPGDTINPKSAAPAVNVLTANIPTATAEALKTFKNLARMLPPKKPKN